MQRSTQVLGTTVLLLTILTGGVYYALAQTSRGDTLSVTFLDIGQGDAIFIQAPSGAQVLIDGGKNRTVIRELARVMPFFDRSLDVVIGTHPDADHIGGLPEVLKRYRVGLIVRSSVEDREGVDAAAFDGASAAEVQGGAHQLTASRGQIIDIGGEHG